MAVRPRGPELGRGRVAVTTSALAFVAVAAGWVSLRGMGRLADELARTPPMPAAVVSWAAWVAATGAVGGYALAVLRDVRLLADRRQDSRVGPLASPRTVRARTAAALLGMTIYPAGIATAADAAPAVAAIATASTGQVIVQVPDPGWVPTATEHPVAEIAVLTPTRDAPAAEQVVVRRGDCLWDIVRRHLGPDATGPDVARAWPRWYAANREVIGPDPDLLLPGQVLVVPSEAAR